MENKRLKITVACVLRNSEEPFAYPTGNYNPSWVEKLRNMVSRNLDIEHEFVCLTNVDFEINGIRNIPLEHDLPAWWSKMELFNPKNSLSGRILYLDLDILILKSLVPIVMMPILLKQPIFIGPAFGKPKKKVYGVRYGYNSSVLFFDHEHEITKNIWDSFLWAPSYNMRKLRGDQDFLKEYFPDIQTFPKQWIWKLGMCYGDKGCGYIPEAVKILLCMPMKNDQAVKQYEFVRNIWG